MRHTILNWPLYGGHVLPKRTKECSHYQRNPDDIPLDETRAVFDLTLLRRVGEVLVGRSQRPVDKGVRARSYPYALNGITYCYHCDLLAQQHNHPTYRTRLGGYGYPKHPRYRHREGRKYGCTNRSIPTAIYEQDFARLIELLTVKPEAQQWMLEMAIQSSRAGQTTEVDVELEKREGIALCRRRIDAAIHLYGDGRIDRDEYLRRVTLNEREIAHWEARTAETEKIALELSLCIEAMDKMARLWVVSHDDDRQGLARSLFSEVILNLDTHRIVDFKLKPWADRLLILRAALYDDPDPGAL